MSLNHDQMAVAQKLISLARSHGATPEQAKEFASAAYAESGLTPSATNKSSGAAGLFQLLSSGYRDKAKSLGGLYNVEANALAILPDYLSYWKTHPNSTPGSAGAAVERSGEGAGFYSKGLGLLGGVAPAPMAAPDPVMPGMPPTPSVTPPQPLGGLGQGSALRGLEALAAGHYSPLAELKGLSAMPAPMAMPTLKVVMPSEPTSLPERVAPTQPPTAPMTASGNKGLAEAFYDPLGSYDNGKFGGAIGGHSDHVHLSITSAQTMIEAIKQAERMGLHVGENPFVGGVAPVHVKDSYHYRDFPGKYQGRTLGEAIDVSGDASKMAAFYRWATTNLR